MRLKKNNLIEYVYKEVAEELNISKKTVKKVYEQYWQTIKDIISELELSENTTEDYFKEHKTNINLVGLGKLSCSINDIVRYKNKQKYLNDDKNKKRNSKIQQSDNHDELI